MEISNANSNVLTNGHNDVADQLNENALVFIIVVLAGFISLGLFGCFIGIFSGGPLDLTIIQIVGGR